MASGSRSSLIPQLSPDPELASERAFFHAYSAKLEGLRTRNVEIAGRQVFSWTAPVSAAFYLGGGEHPWASHVIANRTLQRAFGTIVNFEDHFFDYHPTNPFPLHDLPDSPLLRTQQPQRRGRTITDRQMVQRAPLLVQAALTAPRTSRLGSLISTLQPDQFRIVTRTASRNILISGHAGTGKTVVTAHRAVWLTSRHRRTSRTEDWSADGTVLVVGPTREWADHIQGVFDDLATDPARIRALPLTRLYAELTRGTPHSRGEPSPADLAGGLAKLCQGAIAAVTRSGKPPTLLAAWEALRHLPSTRPSSDADCALRSHVAKFPSFHEARRNRRFQAVLAYLAWNLDSIASLRSVEHIVVDEAQNLGPLDWQVLGCLNPTGTWTILGDANQTIAPGSVEWDEIPKVLGLEPETLDHINLHQVYRSTAAIVDFADRLLGVKPRGVATLQKDGPQPRVVEAKHLGPGATAIELVPELTQRHRGGLVALLAAEPERYSRQLQVRGWERLSHDSHQWEKDSARLFTLSPESASGLEFDVVVVIEPRDIVEGSRTGRARLYTALTRANRELVVVHSKGLPRELITISQDAAAVCNTICDPHST